MSHFSLNSLISTPNNNNGNNNNNNNQLQSNSPFSDETNKKSIIKIKPNEIPTMQDTKSILRRYYFAYGNPRLLGNSNDSIKDQTGLDGSKFRKFIVDHAKILLDVKIFTRPEIDLLYAKHKSVKLRRLTLKGFKDCILEIATRKNTTIDDLLQKSACSDILKSKSLAEINLFNISYGVLSFYKEPYINRFQSYDDNEDDDEETYNDLNNNISNFSISEKRRVSTGFGTTSRDLLPGFVPLNQDVNSPTQIVRSKSLCISPNSSTASSNKKYTPTSALRRASMSVNNKNNNNNNNNINKNKNLRRRSMALINKEEINTQTVGSEHVRKFLNSCFNYYSTHHIVIGIEGSDYFTFCKDAKLFDSNLILRDIPIIFSSFLGESHKLYFDEFYNSVLKIAEKKMMDIEVLIELINSNLMSNNINVNHFNDLRDDDDNHISANDIDYDDNDNDDNDNNTSDLFHDDGNNFMDKIELSLNKTVNEPFISKMHDSFNKILEESNNTLLEARNRYKNIDNSNDSNRIDQELITNIPFHNNNNSNSNNNDVTNNNNNNNVSKKSLSSLFPTL